MATLTIDDFLTVTPERVGGDSNTVTGRLAAGQALKIETTPGGGEIANIIIPTGKVAKFTLFLSIELDNA